MSSPKVVARHAGLAFVAHSIFVVTVFALEQTLGRASIYGRVGVRILLLVDLPVFWVMEAIAQSYYLVPLRWLVPRSWLEEDVVLALAVNTELIFVLVGGAFYAVLAAGVSLWLGRHEPARNHAASTIDVSPRS